MGYPARFAAPHPGYGSWRRGGSAVDDRHLARGLGLIGG